MNTEKVIGKAEHMRNDEIMTLKLKRIHVNDIEMAIISIISDFEDEIRNPETTEDRKKIAKSSIERRWKPLLEEVKKQFKEQDK
jgi:phosphatidate phosphatase APP1